MKRLNKVLKQDGVETDLIMLIRTLLATTKEIAFRVSQGELAGVLGSTLNENIQGEAQKKLDVIANQLLKDTLIDDDLVKGHMVNVKIDYDQLLTTCDKELKQDLIRVNNHPVTTNDIWNSHTEEIWIINSYKKNKQ